MADKEVKMHVAALADEHAEGRGEARAWLLEHPAASRPHLVELVEAGKPNEQTRGAIGILGQMGEEDDVPRLARLLTRPGSRLSWESAKALSLHPSPHALAALTAALDHQDAEVAGAAAVALGARGDEAARQPLEQLLTHPDEGVRYRAVYALHQLGAGPSRPVLEQHYDHEPSAHVRQLIDESLSGRPPDS